MINSAKIYADDDSSTAIVEMGRFKHEPEDVFIARVEHAADRHRIVETGITYELFVDQMMYVYVKIPFADGEEISVDLTVSKTFEFESLALSAACLDAQFEIDKIISDEVDSDLCIDPNLPMNEARLDVIEVMDLSAEVDGNRVIIWQANEQPVYQYIVKQIG